MRGIEWGAKGKDSLRGPFQGIINEHRERVESGKGSCDVYRTRRSHLPGLGILPCLQKQEATFQLCLGLLLATLSEGRDAEVQIERHTQCLFPAACDISGPSMTTGPPSLPPDYVCPGQARHPILPSSVRYGASQQPSLNNSPSWAPSHIHFV